MPLRGSTGEISGVLGTYMDITAHKEAEASRDRLATAVEQASGDHPLPDLGFR